jgi:uncharacterized membrane protein (Fun14 family)
MSHEGVQTFFVIVMALAFLVQVGMLVVLYRALGELSRAVSRLQAVIEQHVNPLLGSLHSLLEVVREPTRAILTNVAETSAILRQRTASADALLADLLDLARAEIIRVDQLFARVLGKLETATEVLERSIVGPVREASAVISGVRRGLEVLFGRRQRAAGEGTQQEDQLFI